MVERSLIRVSDLFSLEALVVTFLVVGRFKEDPRFAWIPLDLTAATMAGGFALLVFLALRSNRLTASPAIVAGSLLFLAFSVQLCINHILAPHSQYGGQKLIYFVFLCGWPFAAGAFWIGKDPERMRRFFSVFFLYSLWFLSEVLVNRNVLNKGGFIDALSASYQELGYAVMYGAIIATAWVLIARRRVGRFVLVGILAIQVLAILILGARGPVVAYGAALGILVGSSILGSHRYPRMRLFGTFALSALVLSAAGLIAGILLDADGLTFQRIRIMLEAGGGSSVSARVQYFSEAWRLWQENPVFGAGLGSWHLYTATNTPAVYPHNLFLELLAETGLIGTGMFLALIALPFGLRRNWSDWRIRLILMLYAAQLVFHSISGDLQTARLTMLLAGMLYSAPLFAVATGVKTGHTQESEATTSI